MPSKEKIGETGRRPYPFSNRFVFAKVMGDRELGREVAEAVIGREIGEIEEYVVERETLSILMRDARLDVLIRTADETVDLEMQSSREPDIGKRCRFNHMHIARMSLEKGDKHKNLRPAYVVFLCTYDPFKAGLPVYTFTNRCLELDGIPLKDGATTIVVNTSAGSGGLEGPLAELVDYIRTNRVPREGGIASRIDRAVEEACAEEEFMESITTFRYQLEVEKDYAFEEGLAEGKAEGVAETEARVKALMAKMAEAGVDAADIVDAMDSEDMDALFEKYGV